MSMRRQQGSPSSLSEVDALGTRSCDSPRHMEDQRLSMSSRPAGFLDCKAVRVPNDGVLV